MRENNALIDGRLIDLLDILDCRTTVTIYTDETTQVFFGKVYEFLADKDLRRKYKNYEVVGLVLGLAHNILIKEA